jgi:anti-anti-sigma factor
MEIRQHHTDRTVRLDIEGRLIMGVDEHLRDRVDSLLLQGHRDIILNLRDVSQIDTSGLAALTSIRSAVHGVNGRIKLMDLPDRVNELLVITKLITVFDLVD